MRASLVTSTARQKPRWMKESIVGLLQIQMLQCFLFLRPPARTRRIERAVHRSRWIVFLAGCFYSSFGVRWHPARTDRDFCRALRFQRPIKGPIVRSSCRDTVGVSSPSSRPIRGATLPNGIGADQRLIGPRVLCGRHAGDDAQDATQLNVQIGVVRACRAFHFRAKDWRHGRD
jgi:hypothetical protein